MNYLSWDTMREADSGAEKIESLYDAGYLATRLGKGIFTKTRSVRIRLSKFALTSENKRILKKVEHISLSKINLPHKEYHWQIGKLAKDFYETKFGRGIMSAQKIKEILTDSEKSNFNALLVFNDSNIVDDTGFAICYKSGKILHYSYPFYNLENPSVPKSMGLGMMSKAIEWAKENGLEFVYLGSLQRPTDTYKLQFEGMEWFDGERWQTDLKEAKKILEI
ncbi:MAG: hypothetical protein NTV72_01150 [Candidatus Taylorbacteria bacterium]|nr:hypothetical protein [Candidatus Taylorbacteria bacterium]